MNNKINFINNDNECILICTEPIANIYELHPSKELSAIVTNESMPIEIVFSVLDNKKLITIWPNFGILEIEESNPAL